MRLYLVQHGEALPKDVDTDRPLSESGREDIGRLAAWLKQRGVEVGEILHSGKSRARQTAELLEPLSKSGGGIHAADGLAPNDPPRDFLQALGNQSADILVAGHMPFVSRAVAEAITGEADRQLVEFQPGSIAGIARDEEGSWRLFLFTRPEFL